MAKLRVHVKGHHRKGYRSRKGYRASSYVDPHTKFVPDVGKKGRGKKIIKIQKEGSLGGTGFFSKPESTQKKILRGAVKKFGEKSVQGKLGAISVFNKRTNPSLSRKAKRLRTFVAKSYGEYYGE